MRGTSHLSLRRALGAAGILGTIVVLATVAGAAQATGCVGDTWQGNPGGDWFTSGNWTAGVPTSSTDVCIINNTDSVVIDGQAASAASLTFSGVYMEIEGESGSPGSLTLSGDSSIASGSQIQMFPHCSSPCPNADATLAINSPHTLTNDGTIITYFGYNNSDNVRALVGNVTNDSDGTINAGAPLQYSGGTLDNQGTINTSGTLTVPNSVASTIVNDTGGTINNTGGNGVLNVGAGSTFDQAGGTTTPDSIAAGAPVVVVDGGSLGATLEYTGTGASSIEADNDVTLEGSLGHLQNLTVRGVNNGSCPESLLTSASSFTNAGTIDLTGSCDSGVKITSGALTNTGTILADQGATRELKGSLSNSGTLDVLSSTAFDGSGATLTQTAGSTNISPGTFLDLTGSSGVFQLKGGLLESPGSSASHQGSITGSLNNSGGAVAPGTPTAAGDMTISGRYTQGAAGRLTAVIDGTKVGTTYSQLGVTKGSTLGGTLNIVTHSGFHPAASELFTVLGGSADSGKFAKLIGQFPPGGTVGYKPLYGSNNVTLQATPTARLIVKKAGTGLGTVTSTPPGINCGTACAAPFFTAQTVTLTEHPASGHTFKGWSGACTGTTPACKVKMTKSRAVTATFG
jgi:uncharacterized repeat protein (TIGR02543 family)